jgi:1-acyl-sn-glycerol-3-phosphate acyltransferase
MMVAVFYWLVANFFWVMLKIYNRLSVRGLDKALSVSSPVIIAANHCSNLDPIVLGAAFPRRLRYLAKSELFRFAPFGFAIEALGAVPARREDMQGAAGALKFLLERIQKGESVLLFPEGQRSPDGKLKPLEGGVGLLAARTGAPVVPAFIHGTFQALPRESTGYKPVKIILTFGDPIIVEKVEEGHSSKDLRQAVTARLEAALVKMEEEFLLD